MFLSVILTGCEDDGTDSDGSVLDYLWPDSPDPNENVTVVLEVRVQAIRMDYTVGRLPWTTPKTAASVVITFSVGGSTVQTETRTTGEDAWTDAVSATLVVHKGESAAVLATLADWSTAYMAKAGQKTYSWDNIWANAEEWGGAAYYSADLTVVELVKK